MKKERIQIPRSENWKYQSVVGGNGDDNWAEVWVDNKGNIEVESSYSLEYQKKQGIGKFAGKDDETVSAYAREESKKSGGGSSGCCSICKCIWKIFKCSLSVLRQ